MMSRKKSKINGVVEANGGGGGGVSRKPFKDFSNFNLIPTDVLRKLCDNSISATDVQTILSKYRVPAVQFQGNSNTSKSDTSIGSSNFNTIAKRNGPTQLSKSSPSSVKNDEDCEIVMLGEKKNVINLEKFDKVSSDKRKSVCMPMRTTRASHAKNKQTEVTLALDSILSEDIPVVSPLSVKPVQKMNDNAEVSLSEKAKDKVSSDKGKPVCMLLRTTRASHAKNKQKEGTLALDSTLSEDKPVVLPSSVKPVQKMNDKAEVSLSEKTKDKGKETVISHGSGYYDRTKDKGKAIAMPWSSLSEQTVDRGKPKLLKDSFLAAARYTPAQKLNQKAEATAGCSKVSLSEKSKATAVSFSAGTYDKTKDKENSVATPSSSFSEQAVDKGKSKILKESFLAAVSSTPVQTRNQKVNATAGSSKLSLSEKSKTPVVSFGAGTYDKTKDKIKAVATLSNSLSKHEKVKGSSSEMLEQKESRGGVVSASSFRTAPRKRNTRDDLSQDGHSPSRAAWTDPLPKLKKVKCENSYPEEFIKQQRAYFQEVDDFELEVEEV